MRLKKFRGQHLLTDNNMIAKIAESPGLTPADSVIEIGAGTGLLTKELAKRAGRVISFEIDRDFTEELNLLRDSYPNLEIRMEDFLKFDLKSHLRENYREWRIVANIPYNITSPIIQKIIDGRSCNLADAHLLLQREVAQRMVAPPGGKDYGRLSVYVQFFCKARILFTVPPDVFTPPPQVESALIRIEFKNELLKTDSELYFNLVQGAFSARRKQIRNNLKNAVPGLKGELLDGVLDRAGIERTRRGETLSLDEFKKLTDEVSALSAKNIIKKQTKG